MKMKPIIKIAFTSLIIGLSIFFVSAILMVCDSTFDVFREWNKMTAVTTMIEISFGAIMFASGIFLSEFKRFNNL